MRTKTEKESQIKRPTMQEHIKMKETGIIRGEIHAFITHDTKSDKMVVDIDSGITLAMGEELISNIIVEMVHNYQSVGRKLTIMEYMEKIIVRTLMKELKRGDNNDFKK